MRMWTLGAVLAALALQGQAFPATDGGSQVLTTAPVNCVAASGGRKTLAIHSPITNTVNILYCVRSANTPSTACTPATGQPGTYTIAPNEKLFWPYGSAPSNGFDCAAASSTAVIDVLVE
jgi:hypothetical protein